MTTYSRPPQHVPRLRYRTLRAGDLPQSLELLPEHICLANARGELALSSGFVERRLAGHDALQAPDPQRRPALFALTREEARQRLPGPPARKCFEHQPPRFFFNASQRRLLWQETFDDSDELLMATLEIPTQGLKKLWRGIYDRIEDVAPEFFSDAVAEDDGKRGPEKRRQVLAYLRQRPEELRPWARG